MVELGSGSTREIDDFMLTLYACYLIAQNGDARKQELIEDRMRSQGDNDQESVLGCAVHKIRGKYIFGCEFLYLPLFSLQIRG